MNRILAVATLLAVGGCANETATPRTFANNDLQLSATNGARLGCSCAFVMKMDDTFCTAWVKADPDVAVVRFNRTSNSVIAETFVSWAAQAIYVSASTGCRLE